jgi:hypothetical protein
MFLAEGMDKVKATVTVTATIPGRIGHLCVFEKDTINDDFSEIQRSRASRVNIGQIAEHSGRLTAYHFDRLIVFARPQCARLEWT